MISFVGTLALHTHPGPFLDMLEGLVSSRRALADQIRLRLVGNIHPAVQERLDRFSLPSMIERVGHVPLPEAQQEMAHADALILFAQRELARYLPRKLPEYLAAGRPIIIYGEGGEAADLVSSLSAGRRVSGQADFLNFLRDLKQLEDALGSMAIRTWVANHRRNVLAKRFYDILELVIEG